MNSVQTGSVEFKQLIQPSNLKALDKDTADQVITLNKVLLDQVPYHGGLEVEAGLFSIKSSSLSSGFIEIAGEVSEAAGVAFLKTALPFLPIVEKAANFLLGTSKEADLEIGIDAGFPFVGSKLHAGRYALVRAEAAELDPNSLSIDPQTLKLMSRGNPVTKYPYMIIEIKGSQNRDNWMKNETIRQAHNAINEAVRAKDLPKARENLSAFSYIIFGSNDFLFDDALKITKKAKNKLDKIEAAMNGGAKTINLNKLMPPNGLIDTKETLGAPEKLDFGTLEDLDPFH